jgi:DASS family divalent anion:Na+ symporter
MRGSVSEDDRISHEYADSRVGSAQEAGQTVSSRTAAASGDGVNLPKLALLVLVYLLIAHVAPAPDGIAPQGWRLLALFTATVFGLMLQPLPGGALVLTSVTLSIVVAGLPVATALSGYADSTVWLVMAAFFISRALLNTGLARRIALFFVRLFGRRSIGICYALTVSDVVLASMIPSNGARSGGVVLPIVRSIAELYDSHPGETARRIGSYLMSAVYQGICVSAAMFLTGQASNPLAARMAGDTGFEVSWAGWFVAGLVPGICSLLVVPWLVYKLNPPELTHTPEAAAFAARELRVLGGMSRAEWILACVFVVVCGLWVTSGIHGIDIAVTALLGAVSLLVTGVLHWKDVKNEQAAWDIFIWYGGLLMLGKALNDAGVTRVFAEAVGSQFSGLGWPMLLGVALLVYFYAHYAFASITAHILAMFPAFLAVLLAAGAPAGLVVFGFACFANLAAGLTHYGTTPSPMFFGHGYVPMSTWWRIGFIVSVANILIWSTIGFAWWRLIGLW